MPFAPTALKENEMKTTTFETAKVGDRVWCILSGWGEVRGIDSSKAYPIAVYFTRDEFKTYTVNGLYLDGDLNQTLFWDEVVIDAPLKPRTDSALPADEKQISALRDQIAIEAMKVFLVDELGHPTLESVAENAYTMADAMLKERNSGWTPEATRSEHVHE